MFEQLFPRAFFDRMIYLAVHLVRKVRLCGPFYLRWMYTFERFIKILKGYVRNRTLPEGYIVQCYIVEEAIEFCPEYLLGATPIGIPRDSIDVNQSNRGLSGAVRCTINRVQCDQAHRTVLQNVEGVQPYKLSFNYLTYKFNCAYIDGIL